MKARAVPAARAGVLALTLVGAGTAFFWREAESARTREAPPETPFGAEPTACPPDVEPLASARNDEQRGRAMQQRHPFDQAEGVRAVAVLLRAAHCYRAAGATADADRVQVLAVAWRADIVREYRSHLVRMRLAIEADRGSEALPSVRVIRRMLLGSDDGFARSMRGLEQRLAREDTRRKQTP